MEAPEKIYLYPSDLAGHEWDEEWGDKPWGEDCVEYTRTDILEVKDVDLGKEIQNIHKHFHDYYGIVNSDNGEFAKVEDMVQIAKYFYELGLKTQKGE